MHMGSLICNSVTQSWLNSDSKNICDHRHKNQQNWKYISTVLKDGT